MWEQHPAQEPPLSTRRPSLPGREGKAQPRPVHEPLGYSKAIEFSFQIWKSAVAGDTPTPPALSPFGEVRQLPNAQNQSCPLIKAKNGRDRKIGSSVLHRFKKQPRLKNCLGWLASIQETAEIDASQPSPFFNSR